MAFRAYKRKINEGSSGRLQSEDGNDTQSGLSIPTRIAAVSHDHDPVDCTLRLGPTSTTSSGADLIASTINTTPPPPSLSLRPASSLPLRPPPQMVVQQNIGMTYARWYQPSHGCGQQFTGVSQVRKNMPNSFYNFNYKNVGTFDGGFYRGGPSVAVPFCPYISSAQPSLQPQNNVGRCPSMAVPTPPNISTIRPSLRPRINVFGKNKSFRSSEPDPPTYSARSCSECERIDTPLWRKGPLGPKTLCNACGIRYRKAKEASKSDEAAASLHGEGHNKHPKS